MSFLAAAENRWKNNEPLTQNGMFGELALLLVEMAMGLA
jgi:hypothetical protein